MFFECRLARVPERAYYHALQTASCGEALSVADTVLLGFVLLKVLLVEVKAHVLGDWMIKR